MRHGVSIAVVCLGLQVACGKGGPGPTVDEQPFEGEVLPPPQNASEVTPPPTDSGPMVAPMPDAGPVADAGPADAMRSVVDAGAPPPACPAVATSTHETLDSFRSAFPVSFFPLTQDEVEDLRVALPGRAMNGEASSGDEHVDRGAGGVSPANLVSGRSHSKQQMLDALNIEAGDIVHEEEPEPETSEGGNVCNRVGIAWGSVLYRTASGAANEAVYLYVGLCNPDDDVEAFFHSEAGVEVCPAGTVP